MARSVSATAAGERGLLKPAPPQSRAPGAASTIVGHRVTADLPSAGYATTSCACCSRSSAFRVTDVQLSRLLILTLTLLCRLGTQSDILPPQSAPADSQLARAPETLPPQSQTAVCNFAMYSSWICHHGLPGIECAWN